MERWGERGQPMNGIRKTCRKENGSTLVVVLLVMAVFSVMGLMLIGVTLAHSRQIGQSIAKIQATNAAEMGLKAYDQKIERAIDLVNDNLDYHNTLNAAKTALDSALPDSINADDHQSITSMQGSPDYDASIEIAAGENNEITLTIQSVGTVQKESQTIVQHQILKYNYSSSDSNGGIDSGTPDDGNDFTPDYLGLSLPYVDGSFHNGYLPWLPNDYQPKWISNGSFVHHGSFYINHNVVYIDGKQVTTDDTIGQTVDLSQIRSLFLDMPLTYPPDQQIDGAQWNNDSNVIQNNYPNDINFSSFNLNSSNPNVIVDGKAYINSSINTGKLQSGTITFNDDVAINGDLNAGHDVKFIFNKNVFINGSINASKNAKITIQKSLYINGSNINLNDDSSLDVGSNACIINAGSINGTGNAIFNGNVYFDKDYNSSGSNHFYGYVFINGSFNNSGPLTFERTVYVQGDFYPKAYSYSVNFKQGIITAGNTASPHTKGDGQVVIGPQQRAGSNGNSGSGGSDGGDQNDSGGNTNPITVLSSNTNYQ
jgi:Tfp pilus assembly protein PilX